MFLFVKLLFPLKPHVQFSVKVDGRCVINYFMNVIFSEEDKMTNSQNSVFFISNWLYNCIQYHLFYEEKTKLHYRNWMFAENIQKINVLRNILFYKYFTVITFSIKLHTRFVLLKSKLFTYWHIENDLPPSNKPYYKSYCVLKAYVLYVFFVFYLGLL
jgi:hypothetical protein